MDNLLANAWHFADNKVEVLVEKVAEPISGFRFGVRDDGPGIDPMVRPHLFKPGSGKAVQEGQSTAHGYGLYLSRRAIENLGGKMFLDEQSESADKTQWPGAHFVVFVRESQKLSQGETRNGSQDTSD